MTGSTEERTGILASASGQMIMDRGGEAEAVDRAEKTLKGSHGVQII
jgi:hypothetical protein